jgi:hypothetical protein
MKSSSKRPLFVFGTLSLAAVGAVLAAGSARAGLKSTWTVTITPTVFYGDIGAVRNSGDSIQYLGCELYKSGAGALTAFCSAADDSGNATNCSSTNADIVKAVASVNGDSSVMVFYGGSPRTCTSVYVDNYSYKQPKAL